jgi:hypothetical protein
VVSRIARLALVAIIAAFGARAEDLRGPQKPDGSTPSAKPKASAVFEEVTTSPEAPPPAPEGEERRAIGELFASDSPRGSLAQVSGNPAGAP